MVGDNQTIDINPLIIFHQNIGGLRKNQQVDKLYVSEFSAYLVFLENHLKQFELN
jgi:hypothetical protein